MAVFPGARLGPVMASQEARLDTNGSAAFDSAALHLAGSEAPFILRGGSARFATSSGNLTGHDALNGDVWPSRIIPLHAVLITGRRDTTGANFIGRGLTVTAVYRNSDRLTIAGYVRDLAGQPLRQFQLQFVGLTVQDHFTGSASNLDGIYVAYLDVGDTYTAYAFSPTSGLTYRLESRQETPNQTNLTFRLLTKRGVGEGLFLQGGG